MKTVEREKCLRGQWIQRLTFRFWKCSCSATVDQSTVTSSWPDPEPANRVSTHLNSQHLNSTIITDVSKTASKEVKGKGTHTWYNASSWIIISEALRYGKCSQEISQFYLHTQVIGMSHRVFAFPAIAGTHLPTPEGWKAELAWVAWLRSEIVYLPKGSHSSHY